MLTPTTWDLLFIGISILAALIGHSIYYVIPYPVLRCGWAAFVASASGQRVLTTITRQDLRAIQDVLDEANAEAMKTAVDFLVEHLRRGRDYNHRAGLRGF